MSVSACVYTSVADIARPIFWHAIKERLLSSAAMTLRPRVISRQRSDDKSFLRSLLFIPIDGPDIVEQLHPAECVLARLLLEMRRMEIAHRDVLGQTAVVFVRFGMDGEKAHVIGLHVVVFYQAVTDRRRRRPERSFGADL